MKLATICIPAALLLSTAAYAQQPAQTSPPATAPAPMPAPGVPTAPAPSAARSATTMQAPWLGTQVWKQGVYDQANARIGEIDDVVIGADGRISDAVIGVGGFLGIGEKAVAVPFTTLKPMRDGNRIWFVLDQTKDQLTAAPAYDLTRFKR